MATKTERATAFHEAGHAVAAWQLSLPIKYVTIVSGEGFLGQLVRPDFGRQFVENIECNLTAATRWRIEREVICIFSGPEAERKLTGRYNHTGASKDYRDAFDLISRMYFDPKAANLYSRLMHMNARSMIANKWNWKAVRALASALLKERTIRGNVSRQIMFDATQPQTVRRTLAVNAA